MASNVLVLDSQALAVSDVASVARDGRRVALGDGARERVAAARAVVDRCATGREPVYGVNTGFGSLSRHQISPGALRDLQHNLVRSHAGGVGDPLPGDVVRAMLVILAASLSRGLSGARVELVEAIIALLNHDVTPVVPSRGSVGASGDLAPLSHAALVLIGEGEATVGGRQLSGAAALDAVGLRPVHLEAKEGLSLVNGTHLITALGALVLSDASRVTDAAIAAAALAIDACRATDAFLDPRLHAARRHDGQIWVAEALRARLEGSEILAAHRVDDPRVQDPYCLRASPQVIGAAIDAMEYVESVIEGELGAVTDNPLVFPGDALHADAIVSGANFHGLPPALPLEILTIALAHVAGIAERRIYWLLKASDEVNPVNAYLSPEPGLHSGLMISQYTAAACCNELQTLCAPATVANIPTAAGIEDYNSMGATAGHQARAGLNLARDVIAIELLVMVEAMEYQRPLRSGASNERTVSIVREVVPRLTADRPPAPDIAAIATLIRDGAFGA